MATVRINENGDLILPAETLTQLGWQPGDTICLERIEQSLQLYRQPQQAPDDVQQSIARKNLQTGIQFVRGVGPKLSELLAKRDIRTVEDALFCLPLRYEDRRQLVPIRQLKPGATQVFQGRVISCENQTTRGGRTFFEAVVSDESGSILFKWFHGNPLWLKRTWQVGKQGIFTGDVSSFGHRLEVHHPEVEWLPDGADVHSVMAADPVNFGRIVPVYPLTEGLQQKGMRRIMQQIVSNFLADVGQVLPEALLVSHRCLPLRQAVQYLHHPPPEARLQELNEGQTKAHRSLAFDEFFFWELGLALKRQGVTLEEGIAFEVTHRYTKELARLLPFQLTAAQRRVLSEIKADMMAPHPMHRLVQGDVGSGKTLVALMAALIAVENGYQVAIMAPTEILAEQHWHNIHHWCEQLGVTVVLLTASMKGKARKEALQQVADGHAGIVIGTHAVIQDKVTFQRLGLGIVDEQHRFGVVQRGILKKKGNNPDILVMTATPIPRTLAMTLFGDLSLSVIDELPPGRTPIETRIYFESRRKQVYQMMRDDVGQGRQVYVIYPLVEESEKSDLKAATQMAEQLQQDVFPDLRVGLLHGKLKPEEKEQVMSGFKQRELDILVATTVIEVGIDVPNATLMVIEHAERFGLSQLHQLRGRVGRGSHASRCILLTPGNLSEDGERRLRVMEANNDGFKIAEADLEIRGPGDFLGTRQSGMPDFRVASILRDGAILEQARTAAFQMLEKDPALSTPAGSRIREELLRRWGSRLELANIA